MRIFSIKVKSKINVSNYWERKCIFKKGDEVGRFMLGSTVVVCFGMNKIHWEDEISIGSVKNGAISRIFLNSKRIHSIDVFRA